jgi:hypothetical protein
MITWILTARSLTLFNVARLNIKRETGLIIEMYANEIDFIINKDGVILLMVSVTPSWCILKGMIPSMDAGIGSTE